MSANPKKTSTEVFAEHEHKKLSREDQKAFLEALMNPPKPNEKMLAAARRFNGL